MVRAKDQPHFAHEAIKTVYAAPHARADKQAQGEMPIPGCFAETSGTEAPTTG
jgi:hypothetical protein